MIRLKSLLTELEKDKWHSVSDTEVDTEKETILNLVQNAYKELGGHPNFQSSNDVTSGAGGDEYEVIDLDNDPELDAVIAVKIKPSGKKFVAIGHDGSKEAKSAAVNRNAELLKKPGWYIEVSDKIKDILLAKGVKPVTDEETVRKALKGKDIVWHGDGTYDRKIGNEMHTKIMLGNPKK
jgi:hypothetical protein